MPHFILKADPDQDWYCDWSTIVDAPCRWGTRAELTGVDAKRFARADANGTSAAWPELSADEQPFGWSDRAIVLGEAAPDYRDGGCWLLPRKNLRAFCEATANGEDTTALCEWEPHA